MQNHETIFVNVKLPKQAIEFVLHALAQMPYAQSAGLIKEIESQANQQLEEINAKERAPE